MVYPRGVIPPGTLWAVFIEILIDSARMIETLSLLIFTPVDSLGFFRILFFFSSLCHLGTGRGGVEEESRVCRSAGGGGI